LVITALPPAPAQEDWLALDAAIEAGWDRHLTTSTGTGALLALPFPYLAPFTEGHRAMYAWDTYFINRALLAHGRVELVRNHIFNYLQMISRFGFMPNANLMALTTRSQTPVFPDSVWRYVVATGDMETLNAAYPLLRAEYASYWNAPHHATAIGLATNRDLGDRQLSADYAAEAETGLDWTPIYDGDVRRCAPLITNCALVRYAHVLAEMADALGLRSDAARFAEESENRSALIRNYCWDERSGLFVEYDYVRGAQLPYVSDCTLWPLWARVATSEQAVRLEGSLPRLEQEHGLACTEQAYEDPHPTLAGFEDAAFQDAVSGGHGQLQWMYPAGWACMQIIAVEGLDAYGYSDSATRIAARFLKLVMQHYQETGTLWEKYNVVDGSLALPNSRYGNAPMPTSWTTAAAVLFGRRLFDDPGR
jgi:alpha,alpha-trehalase